MERIFIDICQADRPEFAGEKMIGLIATCSRNNVIGKDVKIPWRISGEQKQFKDLTTGNVVIMGRRTYEEIGHPLRTGRQLLYQ